MNRRLITAVPAALLLASAFGATAHAQPASDSTCIMQRVGLTAEVAFYGSNAVAACNAAAATAGSNAHTLFDVPSGTPACIMTYEPSTDPARANDNAIVFDAGMGDGAVLCKVFANMQTEGLWVYTTAGDLY